MKKIIAVLHSKCRLSGPNIVFLFFNFVETVNLAIVNTKISAEPVRVKDGKDEHILKGHEIVNIFFSYQAI